MRNLQLFVLCTASQIIGGDFAKFCGLRRIYELYLDAQPDIQISNGPLLHIKYIHTNRVSAGLQTKCDDDRYNADEMAAGVSNSDAATTDAYDDTAYHSWLKPAKIKVA